MPRVAKVWNVSTVELRMPNSPKPALPRKRAVTIEAATASSRESAVPVNDQKAPWARR